MQTRKTKIGASMTTCQKFRLQHKKKWYDCKCATVMETGKVKLLCFGAGECKLI